MLKNALQHLQLNWSGGHILDSQPKTENSYRVVDALDPLVRGPVPGCLRVAVGGTKGHVATSRHKLEKMINARLLFNHIDSQNLIKVSL